MTLLDSLIHCYNSITPFQAAISLSITFFYILYLILRDHDVPPGPRGFPLLGYWPFLKTETCHMQLNELGKKFGDVFSFRVSGQLFIHLGSIKAIREAHLTKSDSFQGRFTGYSLLSYIFRDGVAFINGEPWRVLRKFFVLKFKEYGMNSVKENVSNSICDALKDTVEELRNSKGRPIKITDLATRKCMLVIRRIIFNDQVISEEEFQELIDQYCIVTGGMTSTNLLLIGNFAKYFILSLMPSHWSTKCSNDRIEEILSKVIERQKSEYDEKHASNLIDCYFKERDDRRSKGDPTAVYFTDRALVSSLSQFVTDGVLTVGIFIGVFLSTLVEYPDEQEKLYKEIVEVLGPERLPTIEDKTKLPYTTAFIYEVMRYSDSFPLFPSLQCSKETTIHGYKIPEGSITLINLYAAHRNPETYENPDEFNPARFLSTPDKQRSDLPVLFGVGKRACMGEAFSMIQSFLLITTIVQNFRLTYPDGATPDNKFWSQDRVQICAHPRSQVDGKVL